jgi:hypothetical protein
VVLNRSGALIIHDQKGREKERHAVYGARLKVKDGQDVKQGQLLVEWDPYSFTIMAEEDGQATFKDILDGQTVHEQVDENTGMSTLIIIESPDEKKQPRIEVRDGKGKILRKYLLAVGGAPWSRTGRTSRPATCWPRSRARPPRSCPSQRGPRCARLQSRLCPAGGLWRVGLPLPVVRRALAALRNCPCEHSRRDELRVDPPTVFETEQPH